MFWRRVTIFLLCTLAFAIPIEHKYDKVFRSFSLKLIPQNAFLPSFFEKKIYFYPSDLIALALLFIALFAFRTPLIRFFSSRNAIFLWIVFLFTLISIVFSPLAHYPTLYLRLLQLLTPIVLFSFLANVCWTEEKSKIASLLLGTIIVMASIQSCLAIAQYAIQGPLGLRLLSEPSQFCAYSVPSGQRWIFDASSIAQRIELIRPSGTLPHANVLGGFLSVSMLALYTFFSIPRLRILSALLLPIQFFAMSLTMSRSALFSWVLGTLVWFAFFLSRGKGFRMIWRDPAIRVLCSSIAAAMIFSAVVLHEQIVHRGGIVNYNGLSQASDALRIRYQNIALEIIKDNPLHGAGFHQLSIRALDYTKDDPNYAATSGTHNIYLYLAAETGLFSLAAFLFFIGSLLWAALRTPFTPYLPSLTAIFIAFLFIGGCDFYPLLFQQGKLLFFLTAGLLAGHVRLKQDLLIEAS